MIQKFREGVIAYSKATSIPIGICWFSLLLTLPTKRQRLIQAATEQKPDFHCLHDPIEDDPRYKNQFEVANKEADALTGERRRGSCHQFWHHKKKILRRKFGIIWYSPAEMNWTSKFD